MRARVLALGFITLISLMLCVYVLAGAQRTAAAVPAFPRLHPEATRYDVEPVAIVPLAAGERRAALHHGRFVFAPRVIHR